MKSTTFIASALAIVAISFTSLLAPSSKNAAFFAPEFEANGIMLPEVVISSLPTFTLPEIFVRPADSTDLMPEFTLPEVEIVGQKMPEFTLPEVVISAKKTRA